MIEINKSYYIVNEGLGSSIIHGQVIERNKAHNDYYKVRDLSSYATLYIHKSYFFNTEYEASNFIRERDDKAKDVYRESIEDISDLVKFCLNNTVCSCEEYTNHLAREVAIEKCKEFGIELDNV